MNCFKEQKLSVLRQAPLQQFWRDHLLAGSMIQDDLLGYDEGAFIVLFPAVNSDCQIGVKQYRDCLCDATTFDSWTLKEFAAVLSLKSWIESFRQRDLDFRQLDDCVSME